MKKKFFINALHEKHGKVGNFPVLYSLLTAYIPKTDKEWNSDRLLISEIKATFYNTNKTLSYKFYKPLSKIV